MTLGFKFFHKLAQDGRLLRLGRHGGTGFLGLYALFGTFLGLMRTGHSGTIQTIALHLLITSVRISSGRWGGCRGG